MSRNKPKNHYDSLGIQSTSTQGEVKSAYYKLSMMYHPDKNQGNPESSQKFRDITEAYEVLGNVKTRKLYDKGKLLFLFFNYVLLLIMYWYAHLSSFNNIYFDKFAEKQQ